MRQSVSLMHACRQNSRSNAPAQYEPMPQSASPLHVREQYPPCHPSVARMHTRPMPHSVSVVHISPNSRRGIVHIPATHTSPPPQRVPHMPQFIPSVVTSTHMSPQIRRGAMQLFARQIPARHNSVAAHALPQRPQLVWLVCKSTHAAPHTMRGATHGAMHVPPTHVIGLAHALPQRPQLVALVWVSTHAPPHVIIGARHPASMGATSPVTIPVSAASCGARSKPEGMVPHASGMEQAARERRIDRTECGRTERGMETPSGAERWTEGGYRSSGREAGRARGVGSGARGGEGVSSTSTSASASTRRRRGLDGVSAATYERAVRNGLALAIVVVLAACGGGMTMPDVVAGDGPAGDSGSRLNGSCRSMRTGTCIDYFDYTGDDTILYMNRCLAKPGLWDSGPCTRIGVAGGCRASNAATGSSLVEWYYAPGYEEFTVRTQCLMRMQEFVPR